MNGKFSPFPFHFSLAAIKHCIIHAFFNSKNVSFAFSSLENTSSSEVSLFSVRLVSICRPRMLCPTMTNEKMQENRVREIRRWKSRKKTAKNWRTGGYLSLYFTSAMGHPGRKLSRRKLIERRVNTGQRERSEAKSLGSQLPLLSPWPLHPTLSYRNNLISWKRRGKLGPKITCWKGRSLKLLDSSNSSWQNTTCPPYSMTFPCRKRTQTRLNHPVCSPCLCH